MPFTLASQNLLAKNPRQAQQEDIALGSGLAALRGFQEVTDKSRPLITGDKTRASYALDGIPLAIDWDRKIFSGQPYRGVRKLHGPMPGSEDQIGFAARYLQFVEMLHKPGGERFMLVNLHATNGALKPETDTQWDAAHDAWKNEAVRTYWLGVVAFLARQMRRNVYTAILVVGDFNGRLLNRDEWYYPGPLLDGLLTMDLDAPESIDHISATLDSEVSFTRRRFRHGNSDHPISLVDVDFLKG